MVEASDIEAIEAAARREIDQGLIACQVALGFEDRVHWQASFGAATDSTRFWIASATKPMLCSALWLLIGEGKLEVERPVAEYVPAFAAHGKSSVTVEQLFLMTSGFPNAPMTSEEGADPEARLARMASWTLEWPPGQRYEYHPMSAHWVLAQLIENLTGVDFCRFVEERITRPLGLPRLLGIPREEQRNIAQLSEAADPATRELFDYAAKIAAGEPGGGAVATAGMLARFYQALLHNPGSLWDPAVLADATANVRCTLPDPLMKQPANRSLGLVIGQGFGSAWPGSATAFGWPGAGGQIAFAEPATGISFAFFQIGDTDPVSQFLRGMRLSKLALALSPGPSGRG